MNELYRGVGTYLNRGIVPHTFFTELQHFTLEISRYQINFLEFHSIYVQF